MLFSFPLVILPAEIINPPLWLSCALPEAVSPGQLIGELPRWPRSSKGQQPVTDLAARQTPQTQPGFLLPARPDAGHKPSRLTLGYGHEDSQHFLRLAFRLAYHDLLDPEAGYTPGAQIEFLDAALRYNTSESAVELDELKLIDIVSLSPRDLFIKPLSWKLSLGTERQRLAARETALVTELKGGLGLTYHVLDRAFVFGFFEGSVRFSDRLAPWYAVGAGPSVGMISDLNRRWRIKLSARTQHFFLGAGHSAYELALEQRVTLSKQSALRFRLSQRQEINYSFLQGEVAYQWYF